MRWGVKLPRRRNIKFIAGQKQSKKALGYKMLSVFIIFALVAQSMNPGLSEYIAQIVTKHQRTPQPLASQQDVEHVPALDSASVNENRQKSITKPSDELAKKLADEREQQLKGKAQDHRKVKLLDEGRSENKRTFLNADGSRTVEHSSQATSFKDKNDKWQDVDVSLVQDASGKWHTKANSWRATFDSTRNGGVQLSVDGKIFSLKPVNDSDIKPKVSGKAPNQIVTYENVWQDVDLQYKVSGSQIKETVILHGKNVPSEYEFTATGANLIAEVGTQGAFRLDGDFAGFKIAAPTVATHDKGVVTNNTLVRQTLDGDKVRLSLDQEWLQSQPEKSFPIIIDPTVYPVAVGNNYINFVSNGDTCLPTEGCGNSIGRDPFNNTWRFAYRAAIPSSPGQYLVNAKLHVEMPPPDSQIYYGVTGARSIKVTKAGCTNSFNCVSKDYGEVADTVAESADIELISLYRAAVEDGNTNPWMIVRGEEGSTESYKFFDDTKTKMSFTYDTLPSQSIIAAGAPVDEGVSASTQPKLASTESTDPDGPGPLKYRYVIGTDKSIPLENPFNIKRSVTGVIANSGLLNTPEWVVPANVLQDGKTYYWQATTWDNYQGAPEVYGPVYSFKVDLRNGKDDTQAYDDFGPVSVDFATGNLVTGDASHSLEALGGQIGLGLDYNSPQRSQPGLIGQYWNDPGATRTFPSSEPEVTRTDPNISFAWGSNSPKPGVITTDNFLARWSGYFIAPQDGTYLFGTTSDDRSRIYVDGSLHADGWSANPTDQFGTQGVALESGEAIPIKYEFAEWSGAASARMLVKTADSSITSQVIPNTWLQTGIKPIATPHGLVGHYYTDDGSHTFPTDPNDASRIFLTRTDTSLHQDWGDTSPVPNGPKDNFMVRWTGFFTAPTTDTYTFGAGSDDGVRIILNGNNTVVNAWSNHSASPVIYASSGIALDAGETIPITIEYYEAAGNAEMGFYVKRASLPSAPDTIVDSSWLTPQAQPLPAGWSLDIGSSADLRYDYAVIGKGSVVLHDSTGETYEYKYDNGGFKPPVNESGHMVRNGDGSVTLQDADSRTYIFNSNGTVRSVSTPVDDRNPAELLYTYGGSPTRLTQITDGVASNRWMKLLYSGDVNCPTAPSGFMSSAPAGMLCGTQSYDGDITKFFYTENNGVPRLARVEKPGGEMTDYGYDATGRVTQIRDSLANDAIAAGVRAQDTNEKTDIAYDALGRVSSVTLPAATVGATRLAHSYEHLFNSTTLMHVTNATEPSGFTRKITYDGTYRTLTDTDIANLTTETEWHSVKDLALSSTEPTGLKTTNIYDYTDRVTDEYGPAPEAWFGSDRKPLASPVDYISQVPHSQTLYDEGINGLEAAYYNVATASNGTGSNTKVLFGDPEDHSTGIGPVNGDVVKTWNSAAPITPDEDYGWGARLSGDIHLEAEGSYTFRIFSDDGVRLWIDDRLVIDSWADGGPRSHTTGTFNTSTDPGEDWHRIRLDYYNKAVSGTVDSDARLELYMTAPGGTETSSLGSILKPRYGLVTTEKELDSNASVGNRVTTNNYGTKPELGLLQSSTQDPTGLNLATSYTYEAKGSSGSYLRQTSKTLPGGNTTNYTHYGGGETRQNPCNTSQTFKQAGMLKRTTEPDPDAGGSQTSRFTEFVYDDAGRVVAEKVKNDNWTCHIYDDRGRILATVIPNNSVGSGRTIDYDWAVDGNPLITSKGDIETTVDLLGREVGYRDELSYTFVTGLTTAAYDNLGRMSSRSSSKLGLEEFTYDNFDRLINYKLDGITYSTSSYDNHGRLSQVTYPNAGQQKVVVGLDSLGRENALTYTLGNGTTTVADTVVRSQSGNVVSGTERGQSKSYTYDKAGRLTAASIGSNGYSYSFGSPSGCSGTYNVSAGKNANRTSQTVNGSTTTYCYDYADRLTKSSDTSLTNPIYDAHGNIERLGVTSNPKFMYLEYDASGRNMGYQEDYGRSYDISFWRDDDDRITYRSVWGNEYSDTWNGYTGSGDAADFLMDEDTNVIEKYLQLPGGALFTNRPNESTNAKKKTYSLPNLHGDAMLTTDAAGAQTGTFTYDPFGKLVGTTVPNNLTGAASYGHLGQHQRLSETKIANQPTQMGARVYIPTLGRFTAVDPVEGANRNSYVYPPDPINNADINGEFPIFVPLLMIVARVATPVVLMAAKAVINTFGKKSVSKKPGVYITMTNKNRVYVGQASNYAVRAGQHHRKGKINRNNPRIHVDKESKQGRDSLESFFYHALGGKRAPWLENKIKPPTGKKY